MGWLGLTAGSQLFKAVGWHGVFWGLLGGLLYTTGGVCDAVGWPVLYPGLIRSHEILHLCDMGGTFAHVVFVIRFVLPFRRCERPVRFGRGLSKGQPSRRPTVASSPRALFCRICSPAHSPLPAPAAPPSAATAATRLGCPARPPFSASCKRGAWPGGSNASSPKAASISAAGTRSRFDSSADVDAECRGRLSPPRRRCSCRAASPLGHGEQPILRALPPPSSPTTSAPAVPSTGIACSPPRVSRAVSTGLPHGKLTSPTSVPPLARYRHT